MASGGAKEYDVVLFGATGFTGKFVAEELQRLCGDGRRAFTWAAAGRSRSKVAACLQEVGVAGVDVLTADVGDAASLEAMCAQASVLINCVGPYQLFGEPVVQACIAQHCNYVDITGETYFMEQMVAVYGERAREAGVYLVSACGFDCIPNDLGALMLQQHFVGQLAYVDSYMAVSNSKGFNIGTWESFLRSIRNHRRLSELRREQAAEPLPFPSVTPPKKGMLFHSNVAHRWCALFPGPDRAVVYRSQRYRYDSENAPPFKFRTFFCLESLAQAIGIVFFFGILLLMVSTNFGLSLLLKFPRLFSGGAASRQGPTRAEIEKTTFSVTLVGSGYSSAADRSAPPDSEMTVRVRGAEPGYVTTSVMLVQSALCFVHEKDRLPQSGGIYTPAVAFRDTDIIKNMEETGKIKFEVL